MGAQLTAYVMSENAREQAGFYAQALGGEILSTMTFGQMPGTPEEMGDKVMHLAMTVAGGNMLFFSDFPPGGYTRSISLTLTYDDESEARDAFAALSDGGEVKYPLALQPWGAYYGEVQDKFGVSWQIVKHTASNE
ncbi:VOC family protein [Paenibacillus sacheonensis]|uniref:VOC family protein n=1 Tax=Paenibacillus sacheonensis TaxID=742054 RepID=A0A7X4YR25_9BACL|nr:VOC family protein [Paenibacillus sacheonensis]MBM7567095.1 PhnB protein [Paenibacillus sacheonensis]NBC70976.1 VOC family protein [Paenibacillus sacheonensis]